MVVKLTLSGTIYRSCLQQAPDDPDIDVEVEVYNNLSFKLRIIQASSCASAQNNILDQIFVEN